MNYYEELGIGSGATVDEIRKAHRKLSRLFHPDLQSSPELRQLAEQQMRRLNGIVEMLLDQQRRSEYDTTLHGRAVIPGSIQRRPQHLEGGADFPHPSMLAGAVFGGLVVFATMLLFTPQTNPAPLHTGVPADGNLAPSAKDLRAEAPVHIPRFQSKKASLLGAQHREADYPEMLSNPSIPLAATNALAELPPQSFQVASPSALESQTPRASTEQGSFGVGGLWLAVLEKNPVLQPGEYAADFMEVRLTQSGERLAGQLRSRYRVHDRSTNPEVNFRFNGSVNEEEFEWTGPENSRGRVRISIEKPKEGLGQSANGQLMKIHWVAEVPPPGSELMQGSAKLLRLRSE